MRPWTVTRAQSTPFCSRQSSFCSGSQTMAAEMPRPSDVSTKCLAPDIAASSSTRAATMRRPANGTPARRTAAAATMAAARPPFMSALPRPCTTPFATRPLHGGCRQAEGSPSVTTSVWPSKQRVGPGTPPSSQPTTFGRPGATSCTSTENRSRRSHASTASATACSFAPGSPGRKTLGIRTSSEVRSTTSRSLISSRTRSTEERDIARARKRRPDGVATLGGKPG